MQIDCVWLCKRLALVLNILFLLKYSFSRGGFILIQEEIESLHRAKEKAESDARLLARQCRRQLFSDCEERGTDGIVRQASVQPNKVDNEFTYNYFQHKLHL